MSLGLASFFPTRIARAAGLLSLGPPVRRRTQARAAWHARDQASTS